MSHEASNRCGMKVQMSHCGRMITLALLILFAAIEAGDLWSDGDYLLLEVVHMRTLQSAAQPNMFS